MSGLIGSGIEYSKNAMSGFVRLSELEQQRELANKQIKMQQQAQQMQMIGSAVGLVLSLIALF